ncbi:hypothetical protein KFK09_005181 [Dendrobium nobile]|uniref:Uncharacterized protein n=1 Tax=Dendrobium nobile TaxID=94219 RepID=A0A8T3C0J8_DENNO|nr:hypothetical protein KFK09_005181 [Dendrobium nobile]
MYQQKFHSYIQPKTSYYHPNKITQLSQQIIIIFNETINIYMIILKACLNRQNCIKFNITTTWTTCNVRNEDADLPSAKTCNQIETREAQEKHSRVAEKVSYCSSSLILSVITNVLYKVPVS